MATREPRRIQVAKLPSSLTETKIWDMYAAVCYYYPQYTLKTIRKLPYRQVMLLLKTARKMEALKYRNLTQISAAPHSKKGEGVKKLMKHYGDIIKNG